MSARTIAYRTGLFTILREVLYTLAQMGEEPLAAAHLPVFQAHRGKWQAVLTDEIGILESLAKARAAVDRADAGLDRLAVRVSNAIDENTTGANQKQIRAALFKGKSNSRFRRPVLGKQLSDMADWADKLAKCGVPALCALAPEADALVTAGKKADALRTSAQAANREFRDIGKRKQFIDALNASRKEAEGALAKLPFENPLLPQSFADTFFYSEAPRDEEETIEDVKASIDELELQLEERRALLQQMEEEAANAAKAEAARKAKALEADELEAQAKELLKRAAQMRG